MKRTKIKCKKCGRYISRSNLKKHENVCNGKYNDHKKLKVCPFCRIDLTNINTGAHIRWCKLNPKREEYIKKIKERGVKQMLTPQARKKAIEGIKLAHKNGKYKNKKITKKWHHTKKTKQLLSEKRKSYLMKNKEKHNWSLYKNKESKPEKLFREVISTFDKEIIQYYIPHENDRFFELDFADVKNKIGFEINGNQHYNKNGELRKYYLDRHNYFERKGWKIIEIHYLNCYNKNKITNIIKKVYDGEIKYSEKITKEIYNYKEIKKKEKQKIKSILDLQRKEKKEFLIKKRYEQLLNFDLMKFGWITKVSKEWGVSHPQVKRWIKKYYPQLKYYERK